MKTHNILVIIAVLCNMILFVSCSGDDDLEVMLPKSLWEEISKTNENESPSVRISYATLANLLKSNNIFVYTVNSVQKKIDGSLRDYDEYYQMMVEAHHELQQMIQTKIDFDEDNGENNPHNVFGIFLPDYSTSSGLCAKDLGLPSGVLWSVSNMDVMLKEYDGKTFNDFFSTKEPTPFEVPVIEKPTNTDIASYIRERGGGDESEDGKTPEEGYVVVPYNQFSEKFANYISNINSADPYSGYDSYAFTPIVQSVAEDMIKDYINAIDDYFGKLKDYAEEVDKYVNDYDLALSDYYQHIVDIKFSFLKDCGNTYLWGGGIADPKETILSNNNDWAYAYYKAKWKTPSVSDFEELLGYCQWSYILQYGISGWKIVGPNGHALFLPCVNNKSNDWNMRYGYMTNQRSIKSDWTGYIYGYYYYAFDSENKAIKTSQLCEAVNLNIRPVYKY